MQPLQPLQPSLIEVVNGRRAGSIPGGRESAIGNPFDMKRDEGLRDPVCDAFEVYFDAVVDKGEEPVKAATRLARERNLSIAYAWKRPSRDDFMGVLAFLEERQKQGLKTQIQCFCAPKSCHLDIVKAYLDMKREAALSQAIEAPQLYEWSRYAPVGKGYECSTQGDKRFSALNARLSDGRTIEEAYQLDVKGYRVQGENWQLGKGKPPLKPMPVEALYQQYKTLWQQWADENPVLIETLAIAAKGKVLTDRFAATPISQARALADLLNERALGRSGYAPASPDRITALEPHQVFVFGSNTQGRHGKGAALQAVKFGAEYGNPRGRQGRSYAIVTKDLAKPKDQQRSVSLNEIKAQIGVFLDHAIAHPEHEFLVTQFGCDLAGYSEQEIGSLWVGKAIPTNVRLPQAFLDVLQAEQPVVALEVGMIQTATDICQGQRRGQQPLPTHILSVGSQTEAPPDGLSQFPGRVLRLEFDELDKPKLGLKTATPEQLEAALNFGREARQAGGRLFVHCSAGVRRSPTIALAILADQCDEPTQALETLRKLSPNALLIETTVQLIDTTLGTTFHKTALTVEERPPISLPMTQTTRTDIFIHSGGQTGADYGGLPGAEALNIQTGGVAPHGWITEKGPNPALSTRFGLIEGPPGKSSAQAYYLRTELNVQQTDGTVVFGSVDPTQDRGSALTLELADKHGKPWIQFDVAELIDPVAAAAELREWIIEHNIRVLNVAGNRGSKNPVLESLVQAVIETTCREPFQSLETTLRPVACGILLDPVADWQAETGAVQAMLEQITARLAPQEQLLIYCDNPPQQEWLEAIAQTLGRPQSVSITNEPTQWAGAGQKSWLVCVFQGTAETKKAFEAAASMGLSCLGFDARKRTYFKMASSQQTVAKQPELER